MGLFGAFVCCQPSKCNLILFVFIVIIKQFFFRISICTRLLFRAFLPTIVLNFIQFIVTKYFHPKPCSQTIRCTLCIKLAFSKHSWHIVFMQEHPNPQTKVDTNTNHHCFCIVNFQYLLWLIVLLGARKY